MAKCGTCSCEIAQGQAFVEAGKGRFHVDYVGCQTALRNVEVAAGRAHRERDMAQAMAVPSRLEPYANRLDRRKYEG